MPNEGEVIQLFFLKILIVSALFLGAVFLKIEEDNSVYVMSYRLPQSHKAEMDRKVQKFLIVTSLVAQILIPLLFCYRKTLAHGVDYRLVNKKLVADKYPLPRIDDFLDSLANARFFSVLDLFQGFHQVPLKEVYGHYFI